MHGNPKKFKGLFGSVYFWVLAALLSLTASFVLIDSFRYYQSEISIRLVPQNENLAGSSDEILTKLARLSGRLAFYDKMNRENPELNDPFLGLDPDERKADWNRIFEARQTAGAPVLKLTAKAESSGQSRALANSAARTLLGTAGQIYDLRREAEFRIVSGPTTSVKVASWPLLILLSFILGTVSTLIVLSAGYAASRRLSGVTSAETEAPILPAHNFYSPELPKSLDDIIAEEETSAPYAFVKKSSAPSNLPVADDTIFATGEPALGIWEAAAAAETEAPAALKAEEPSEPTEEEYKRRLNQLLRGES